MGKICSNCGYERKPDDPKPDYKCPKCGRVYFKSSRIGASSKSGNEVKGFFIGENILNKKSASEEEIRSDNVAGFSSAGSGSDRLIDSAVNLSSKMNFSEKDSYESIKSYRYSDYFNPAGIMARFFAYFIDSIVMYLIIGVGIFLWLIHGGKLGGFIGLCLAAILYKPVMETLFGSTVGKFFLGIRVVNKMGIEISPFQGLLRNIFFISKLFVILVYFYLVVKISNDAINLKNFSQMNLQAYIFSF